ncbi:MAG: Gldg family protein [bacterium]
MSLVQNTRTVIKLIAVVAILFIVNLGAHRMDWQADMTEANLYTLSDQTHSVLEDVDKKITLLFFHPEAKTGQKRSIVKVDWVRGLLNRYESSSSKVTFREVDPDIKINLAERYNVRGNNKANAIVVKIGKNHSTITPRDMYKFKRSMMGARPQSFRGEEAVTSAILNLTRTTNRDVLFMTGHGEYRLQASGTPRRRQRGQQQGSRSLTSWKSALSGEGFTPRTWNPVENKDLPDTRNLLVIYDPQRPISKSLSEKISKWYHDGGNLFLVSAPENIGNLSSLAQKIGFSYESGYVVGARRPMQFARQPFVFSPVYGTHPAVKNLRKQGIHMVLGRSCSLTSTGDASVSTVLKSSRKSYVKSIPADGEELVVQQQSGDPSGPFKVGLARSKPGRAVALCSTTAFSDVLFGKFGNKDVAMNLTNWTLKRSTALGIRPRPLNYNRIQVTNPNARWFILSLSLLVIPGGLIVWGVMVWWKRRNL